MRNDKPGLLYCKYLDFWLEWFPVGHDVDFQESKEPQSNSDTSGPGSDQVKNQPDVQAGHVGVEDPHDFLCLLV